MSQLAILPAEDLRPLIPSAYQTTEPAVETESVADLGPRVSDPFAERLARPVPIWIFSSRDARLRAGKAIAVRIRSEGSFVFAGNNTLAIEGTGLTTSEAIDDFCLHVTHFYRYYQNLPAERLIGDALRLKALFSELFTEI